MRCSQLSAHGQYLPPLQLSCFVIRWPLILALHQPSATLPRALAGLVFAGVLSLPIFMHGELLLISHI